jgi:DNA modification methylase
MKIETIAIDKINPAKYNPRKDLKPGDPEYEKLKKSINEFDMVEPLILNKRGNILVGGHQRLKVLKEMGRKEVEVSVVDLPPAKEKALNLALNKISGEWDLPLLKDLLQELDTGDFDLTVTGFDEDEIEGLMTQFHVPEEGLTEDDEIPEDVESVCQPGDLWELGAHRLLCGDSTSLSDVERLTGGEKVDLVFTDPPYNVNWEYRGKMHGERFDGILNDNLNPAEWTEFCSKFIANISAILKEGHAYYMCSGWNSFGEFERNLKQNKCEFRQLIVWAKNQFVLGKFNTDYNRQHEQILYGWKEGKAHRWFGGHSETDLWQVDKVHNTKMVHRTEKPVGLAERAIKNSSQLNELVLDLFTGSGSTLIACEKMGRRFCGMELDPKYCDVIINRWQNFTGKTAVLQ